MKKIITICVTFVIVSLLFGCTTTSEKPGDEIPNPITESSAEEILQTLGITFNIPDEARDIRYAIINVEDANPIAQTQFALNEVEYTYRIQSTDAFTDISGAYYDWTNTEPVEISYCSGELRYIEGEAGICLWYDVVPGLMYCLYSDSGATSETLTALAARLFVPAQDVP